MQWKSHCMELIGCELMHDVLALKIFFTAELLDILYEVQFTLLLNKL